MPYAFIYYITCISVSQLFLNSIENKLLRQEIAMYYDKLTRRHNVQETLDLARTYFAQYLNEDWKKEAQNDIQDQCRECSDSGNLGKNQRKC